MKKLNFCIPTLLLVMLSIIGSCKRGDLLSNPNVSSRATPSLVLNTLTATMSLREEEPFQAAHRINQFIVSSYSYYWGVNFYNWTNTEHRYDILRYAVKLEEEAIRQYGEQENVYRALAKFFRAYSAVWLSQRVGDIPFSEAGNPENLHPAFDSQEDVYRQVLELLEDANGIIGGLIANNTAPANSLLDPSGDVFQLTNRQWQKAINAYRLRVLLSLSRRADDTPALEVAPKVNEMLSQPDQFPLPTSNADNVVYRYNAAFNPYIMYRSNAYSYGLNIGKTLLDITTATQDPRTFLFATPAPALYITAGIPYSSFAAYRGVSTNIPQGDIFAQTDAGSSTTSDQGAYSYLNFRRYFSSQDGSTTEHHILLSYAETCFNAAEAIHRGWAAGDAADWYEKGILGSLSLYGINHGATITIGDRLGGVLGEIDADVNAFLAHPDVVYSGAGDAGLQQIVTQKYVSLFAQSGYEAFYNYLRTGYPIFESGGAGIGTTGNRIARRWMYPQNEISYNAANYQAALVSQYQGVDDTMLPLWIHR